MTYDFVCSLCEKLQRSNVLPRGWIFVGPQGVFISDGADVRYITSSMKSFDVLYFCSQDCLHRFFYRDREVESAREQELKKMLKEVLWMAVRYAHGRHTYAPGIVRDVVKKLKQMYPHEEFLRPDPTIKPPVEENLNEPASLRSDWLDDLFDR